MPRTALALLVVLTSGVLHAQTEGPRAFLVAVDDLHLDFRSTPRLRKTLQDLIAQLAREGDTWAVVSTGTSSISLAPTLDLSSVRDTISRFTGNGLKVREQLDAFGNPRTAEEIKHRQTVSDTTIAQAIKGLAASTDLPITVLYLGEGTDTRLARPLTGVVAAAQQARARILVFSPLDLRTEQNARPEEWAAYLEATRASLRTLAEETNGFGMYSRDQIDAALADLSRP
jgi:hypothetical protein